MSGKDRAWKHLPRFIWGDALGKHGFLEKEFMTHTRYPRFICELQASIAFGPAQISGAGLDMIVAGGGYELSHFVFLQPPPTDAELLAACTDAITEAKRYDDLSAIQKEAGLGSGTESESGEASKTEIDDAIAGAFPDGWESNWTMSENGKRAIHASGLVADVTATGGIEAKGTDKLEGVDLGQLMAQAMIFLGVIKET